MIHVLFFVLCLVNSHDSHGVHGIQHTFQEDLELERQLQLINKSPVKKSVHTKFGYIVDCIDIYKQPAFDHPLLKNHKLQRKPSFQNSIEKTSVKNSSAKPIFGLEKDECPRGTVPIRRTTKDNLIQSKLLSNNHILVQDIPGLHLAEVYLLSDFAPYYKVKGTNSIYNPKVLRKDQMSLSHIWVQNGPITDGTNKISFGWHVAPQFYGDRATYIFSSWTSDNFKKTGCFNLYCSGFVQTHPRKYIGSRVVQTSTYGGPISETTIAITQDPMTQNWWLNCQGENIGYFPSKLFSNMTSCDQVGWGGRTLTPPNTPSPPMGSGYFPDEKFGHACYFRQVSYQNITGEDYGPTLYIADTFKDKSDCFDVAYYGDQGKEAGYSLEFGGPGGGSCGN